MAYNLIRKNMFIMSGMASLLYAQPSIAIHVGLVLGLPQLPKSEDAQLSYLKGHKVFLVLFSSS